MLMKRAFWRGKSPKGITVLRETLESWHGWRAWAQLQHTDIHTHERARAQERAQ